MSSRQEKRVHGDGMEPKQTRALMRLSPWGTSWQALALRGHHIEGT